MKRVNINWKRLTLIIILCLLILVTAGIVLWTQATLEPTELAMNALESSEQITVTQTPSGITFDTPERVVSTGVIFYPGGGVDYRAYAPVLRQIAGQGYRVVATKMPLNLAVLKPNAANRVIKEHTDITHWVLAGHSLGGVMAASYVAKHPDIDGLVLLASYPANDALKDSALPVLSISASFDGLATPETINASRAKLPADTVFVEIDGGNHAQFGSYGFQKGDSPAIITPQEQWAQVVTAVKRFLETLPE